MRSTAAQLDARARYPRTDRGCIGASRLTFATSSCPEGRLRFCILCMSSRRIPAIESTRRNASPAEVLASAHGRWTGSSMKTTASVSIPFVRDYPQPSTTVPTGSRTSRWYATVPPTIREHFTSWRWHQDCPAKQWRRRRGGKGRGAFPEPATKCASRNTGRASQVSLPFRSRLAIEWRTGLCGASTGSSSDRIILLQALVAISVEATSVGRCLHLLGLTQIVHCLRLVIFFAMNSWNRFARASAPIPMAESCRI